MVDVYNPQNYTVNQLTAGNIVLFTSSLFLCVTHNRLIYKCSYIWKFNKVTHIYSIFVKLVITWDY